MLTTNQILNNGRYRIINPVRESSGLYEAYDTVNHTNVVLKETVGKISKVLTANQREAKSADFISGAQNLAKIKHPSIIPVQDYFSAIDCHYLVIESVEGSGLNTLLQTASSRPQIREILTWADELLDALNYLHQLPTPVFHRDIKPENVKLTADRKVMLLTAGIAPDASVSFPTPSNVSENFDIHYRPLEQLWGGLDPTSQRVILNSYDEKAERFLLLPFDARLDIFSLGATLYHVVTGKVPPDALDRSIAILDGRADPLIPPSNFDSDIPIEISNAIVRAMSIRREDRFESAAIFRQVLKTATVRIQERENNLTKSAEAPQVVLAESQDKAPDAWQEEIENEQKLLEAEHQRIELRQQELESERQKRIAETERLKREAEAARVRSEQVLKQLEQKKLEQEAEIERQKIVQQMAGLDAERKRAALRLQQLQKEQDRFTVGQERQEADSESEAIDLPVSAAHVLENATGTSEVGSASFLPASEGDKFEISGSLHEPSSAAESKMSAEFALDTTLDAYSETKSSKGLVFAIAGGLLLVVVAAVAVWTMWPTQAPEQSQSEVVLPTASENPSTSIQPPVDQVPAVQLPDSGDSNETADVPIAQETPEPAKVVRSVKDAEKPKKSEAIPAKTPRPKKAVTVDDLINDN